MNERRKRNERLQALADDPDQRGTVVKSRDPNLYLPQEKDEIRLRLSRKQKMKLGHEYLRSIWPEADQELEGTDAIMKNLKKRREERELRRKKLEEKEKQRVDLLA
jgi:hypothetical protein